MNIKKLCSIGILDININLILSKNKAKNLNFNIDSYNTIEDLKNLFQIEDSQNSNYLDFITLSSDNYLINTLLYINRCSTTKTFIEFIMFNQLLYDDNTKFIKKIIEDVLAKNYFFIVENTIMDIPSKIKFIINIIDDKNNDIISCKQFELFVKNEMDIKVEEDNDDNDKNKFQELFLDKINYNFNLSDYLILDLKEIKNILIEYENIYKFLFKILNNYSTLKIILIIDENINEQSKNVFIIKELIYLCDIFFCFKNNMNDFLKSFYSIKKRNLLEKSPSKIFFLTKDNYYLNKSNLITKDFDKFREKIPRISIIFEEFNLIHIYKQDIINKCLLYENSFPLLLIKDNNFINNTKDFIYSNSNKLYHIFIGGFLSRFIYNKSFDICLKVGKLLMIKTIDAFMSKKDCYINQDKYNIIEVKNKGTPLVTKIKKILSKEKRFILDCTNKVKSQKKEYNILSDNNCLGFLTKKYYSKNNLKTSLTDKINALLKKNKKNKLNMNKDKDNKDKINSNLKTSNDSKMKIKPLLPFININDDDKYTNHIKDNYLKGHKKSKTISYYLNSNNTLVKSQKYNYNNSGNSYYKKYNINNRLIKNILNNIQKTENYNKYLFKMYQPNKNFDDFLNEYNNLQNIKIYK